MTATDEIITRAIEALDSAFRELAVASGRVGQYALLAAADAALHDYRERLHATRPGPAAPVTYPKTEG